MMTIRISLLATLLCATACSLIAPDYKPEAAPIQEGWLGTDAAQTEMTIDAQWWNAFGLPEMSRLIEQARKESFDVRAAVARIRQADAQARIAGAPLLPEIDLNLNASRNRSGGNSATTIISGNAGTPIVGSGGTATTGTTATETTTTGTTTATASSRTRIYNSATARLNASYEADFWGRNSSNALSARNLAKASRFDQETVMLTATAGVANTYLALLALKQRIDLAQQNLDAAQHLLKAIQLRADNGLATALDLTQQQNLVATQQGQLPALQLQFVQNRDALAVLLGTPPQSLNIFPESDAPVSLDDAQMPEIAPGLPSQLLARRPDVQTAEAQLQSAHADVNAARAAFFPSIVLTASGGYASSALNNLFRADSLLWSVGASAVQTIFDNGALFGQFDFQKARYDELLQNYRKIAVSSFADVEDALAGTKLLAEQETAQKEATRTAELAFTYAQRQFQGGLIDITTVLNTQRALFTARDNYAQTRLARLQSIVALYKALGGGWSAETKKDAKEIVLTSTTNPNTIIPAPAKAGIQQP